MQTFSALSEIHLNGEVMVVEILSYGHLLRRFIRQVSPLSLFFQLN